MNTPKRQHQGRGLVGLHVHAHPSCGITVTVRQIFLLSAVIWMTLAAPARADINWDGDNAVGNFSYNNNWYFDSAPVWGFGGSLHFSQRNNGAQTSLYNDYGSWQDIANIYWDTTFAAGLTINGAGNGLNFDQKVENDSSYAQVVNIPLSGAKNGASQIELNPVNGDMTLNQPVYNDNDKSYVVYGNNSKLLTVNAALAGGSGVGLTIAQYSKLLFTTAQTFGSGAALDVQQGELWLGSGGSLAAGLAINLGLADANTAKFYLSAAAGGSTENHAITVTNSGGTKVLGGLNSSGAHTFSGAIALAGSVTLEANQPGGTLAFTNAISGSGSSSVTMSGPGAVVLSGANTYDGDTVVSGGLLKLGTNNVIPDGAGKGNVSLNGMLNLNGQSEAINGLSGTGTVDNLSAVAATLTVGNNDQSSTFDGVITNSSGTVSLVKTGTGTLTLSGANTYDGGTTINGGTLIITGDASLGATTGVVTFVGNSTLQAGGAIISFNASRGMVINGSVTATFDDQGNTMSVGGVIGGDGVLVKGGAGTLTLLGAHLHSGGTTVTNGTLAVQNGSGSASGSGLLLITGGGILSGTGSVFDLEIGDGGTLSPGNSPGITKTGNTKFQQNGNYLWEVNDFNGVHGSSPGMDRLDCSGTLTINSSPSHPYTIKIKSLTYGNAAGIASNFHIMATSTQVIATATSIVGFSPDEFTLDTSGLVNSFAGAWSIAVVGVTNLALIYSPRITNVVASTNGVTDPASEINLSWAMPPNGGVIGNTNTTWASYVIFYTADGSQPTTNSLQLSVTNGLSPLGDITTTTIILSNMTFDADVRLAIAGMDKRTNYGPLSTVVTQRTETFSMTQDVISAQSGVTVKWNRRANVVYDVIYQDSTSWGDSLTNGWLLMNTVTNSFPEDIGTITGTAPLNLSPTVMRFYRVAKKDAWKANKKPRIASREVLVAKPFVLVPGENWISLFFTPFTNTVASVLGTNRLPAGATIANATKVSWYSAADSAIATNVIWLASSGNWIYSVGGSGVANGKKMPMNEGFNIEIPGTATQRLVVAGQVTTNIVKYTVGPGGSVAGTEVYNIRSLGIPHRTTMAQSGLKAVLTGGINPIYSDEVRVLDNSAGTGSKISPIARVWLRSTDNAFVFTPDNASAEAYVLEPGDATILIRHNPGTITITNALHYTAPGKNMNP